MEPIEFVASYYYSTVYYIFLLVISWMTSLYYIGSNGQKVLNKEENDPSQVAAVGMVLILGFFIGLRPIARDFGDTSSYAANYNYISNITVQYMPVSLKTEWFWRDLQNFCRLTLRMNVHEFFLMIALGYYGGMLICSIIMVRKNLWLSIMFFLTAFQTFTFSTNGIRNGIACSMVLVAIAILSEKKKLTFWSAILMFLAMGTHRSTMLPSAAALFSIYVIKDTKTALRFWILSIALSLVVGHAVENFFASLGFDDRMEGYHNAQFEDRTSNKFSHTGFRWDFLMYSVFPVVMIWYVTRKRHFNDLQYNVIANTYLFCNAFWIMVIRAAYSNRFAYLSWFIYPMVMAYPLLRMNVWKEQDRRTAIIFFLYSGFTFFMFFIYYFGTTGFKGFDQYWWK